MSAWPAGGNAVVTGASRGIGLAISRALAAEGMRVAMIARGISELRARASELGDRAIAVACDLSKAEEVAAVSLDLLSMLGGAPDVLVNNAGLFEIATVEATAPASFSRNLEINLVAPFLLIRAFLDDMYRRRSGTIVNIGSIADHLGLPGNSAYAASKFGLRALHEVLRGEARGRGVRTILVSPGAVDTPLWDPLDPDGRAGFTPRSEMLNAEAVAAAVRYAVMQPPDVNVDLLRLSRT